MASGSLRSLKPPPLLFRLALVGWAALAALFAFLFVLTYSHETLVHETLIRQLPEEGLPLAVNAATRVRFSIMLDKRGALGDSVTVTQITLSRPGAAVPAAPTAATDTTATAAAAGAPSAATVPPCL